MGNGYEDWSTPSSAPPKPVVVERSSYYNEMGGPPTQKTQEQIEKEEAAKFRLRQYYGNTPKDIGAYTKSLLVHQAEGDAKNVKTLNTKIDAITSAELIKDKLANLINLLTEFNKSWGYRYNGIINRINEQKIRFKNLLELEKDRNTSFAYSQDYKTNSKIPTKWLAIEKYPGYGPDERPYIISKIGEFIGDDENVNLRWGKAKGFSNKPKIVISKSDGSMMAIINGIMYKTNDLKNLYEILKDVIKIPEVVSKGGQRSTRKSNRKERRKTRRT